MSTALRFSRIERSQEGQLLQAIHAILTEVGAHNVDIYDEAYWDWQYRQLPTRKSYVYGVWDGGQLIGYYHVPLYRCMINGEEKLVGNIQDVAVNPHYRGKGLFRQLAEFANQDLDRSEVDLIYTFPNQKSIRTFLKYNNFKTVCTVPAYLRPIHSGRILANRIKLLGAEQLIGLVADAGIRLLSRRPRSAGGTVERMNEITDEVEAVFTTYASQFPIHLIRDKAWLHWRYLLSVRGKHHVMALRQHGKIAAVVVLKEDQMLGNPALLIMDLACAPQEEDALLYLIEQVRKRPNLTGAAYDLIFASGITPSLSKLTRLGFIRVPQKVNPRTLNLLTRSSSNLENAPLLFEQNWLLTLGDWDVF